MNPLLNARLSGHDLVVEHSGEERPSEELLTAFAMFLQERVAIVGYFVRWVRKLVGFARGAATSDPEVRTRSPSGDS